ncbi:hypothetical protein C2G38_2233106 [Gigaspora rosea]|uniref:Uncharacterized protein n=1 Tax=Gigaspora rosea TaxID=44941 RepID=A0A397TRF2_9GLOM|nr:hypothetical protein C2G38_2233106 [Gigaspora rosea]
MDSEDIVNSENIVNPEDIMDSEDIIESDDIIDLKIIKLNDIMQNAHIVPKYLNKIIAIVTDNPSVMLDNDVAIFTSRREAKSQRSSLYNPTFKNKKLRSNSSSDSSILYNDSNIYEEINELYSETNMKNYRHTITILQQQLQEQENRSLL